MDNAIRFLSFVWRNSFKKFLLSAIMLTFYIAAVTFLTYVWFHLFYSVIEFSRGNANFAGGMIFVLWATCLVLYLYFEHQYKLYKSAKRTEPVTHFNDNFDKRDTTKRDGNFVVDEIADDVDIPDWLEE